MAYRLGIDVGGTFTDLLLLDVRSGKTFLVKTPSTPQDPSVGIMEGIERICQVAGLLPGEIAQVLHGTTVATNAVLEGKGARVGLLTTEGYRYILHLARSWTPGPLFGWIIMKKPEPLAAIEDTREVEERLSPTGEVVRPLNEEKVRRDIIDLRDRGIESLTVSLLHSYANPVHERCVKELAAELCPDIPISISSEILPEFREYERTLTTVMNAYVKPKVRSYFLNFERKLREAGINSVVNVVRSDGGLMTLRAAQDRPVYGLLSGPAGGVVAAAYVGRLAGHPSVLSLDMGGTSTDVALTRNGQLTIARETKVGYYPVKSPSVDVQTIGAGGGSIAHVPEVTGALRVGPQSAGADPGPACYGRGGQEATVTDANLVLGHLPPQLVGGEMSLDVDAAHRAIERIGRRLGLDVYQAAQGILDIVNENMFGALRLVSVERGIDPREFALVAFGGAGPMHANALGRLIASWPVIIPPDPGVLSALGFLISEFKNEFAQTFIRVMDDRLTLDEVLSTMDRLGEEARQWLIEEGIPPQDQDIRFNIDVRYYRQGYEIPLDVTHDQLRREGLASLKRRFDEIHHQLYGFIPATPMELVNIRAIGVGRIKHFELHKHEPAPGEAAEAIIDQHRIYFDGEFIPTPIYDRSRLGVGHQLTGPAIITQYDTTTVVLPGYQCTVDEYLNLLIRPQT